MSNELAPIHDDMFSDARVQMIRDQVAKNAPDYIFAAMIDIAKRRRLDPLAKQISLISFKNTWTIITTIDGYRAIAEQTGQYAGSDAPVFTYADPPTKNKIGKTEPESCTVTVYKLLFDVTAPFSATVYFEEYSTSMNNWLTMPRTMLAKVAESHALRKAFPAVMSGMYTSEEMDQAVEGTAREVTEHVNRTTGEIHDEEYVQTWSGKYPDDNTVPKQRAIAPPRTIQATPRVLPEKPAPPPAPDKPHTPPTGVEFYDAMTDPAPETRNGVVGRYMAALDAAGMKDDNYRHAMAWAAGYEGTTKNVPSDVLEKWTRGIKKHPQMWKQTAEMRMVDMQAEQEQLNFQESSEYRDEDMDAAIFDIAPEDDDDDLYDGEYEEVESE